MNIKLNSLKFNGIINRIDEKIVFVTKEKTFEEIKAERVQFDKIMIETDEETIMYDVEFEQMTEFLNGTVKAIYKIVSGGGANEE